MRQAPEATAARPDRLNRRDFLSGAAAAALGASAAARAAIADSPSPGGRISYFMNGEIHVNVPGRPEGRPVTAGHTDFKPSWSKTDDLLVCFRRTKDDPVTVNWKSAIFVVHVDGTGFHTLTDGTRTDFNPTWTRDGRNTPVWNRKNDRTGGFFVMRGRVGGKPGAEEAVTDEAFHTWAHSCLQDGRVLVNSYHPTQGWGVYLLACKPGAKPSYERVDWELNSQGQMHRASVSPDESKICFEYLKGSKFQEPGHALYVADFDPARRTVTNLKAIANADHKPHWYAYPRWIDGGTAVVYHRNSTGKGELYVHRLSDASTRRVSTNPAADYRYPHGEAAPC